MEVVRVPTPPPWKKEFGIQAQASPVPQPLPWRVLEPKATLVESLVTWK